MNGLGSNSGCVRRFSLFQNRPPGFLFSLYQGYLLGGRAETGEAAHSPASNAEGKTDWSYTSTPPMCLHSTGKDIFTFMCIRANFVYHTLANYDISLLKKTLTLTTIITKVPFTLRYVVIRRLPCEAYKEADGNFEPPIV